MASLHLAQINMPLRGNDGAFLEDTHKYITRMLAQEFGGFTAIEGHGAWLDERTSVVMSEKVMVYQVAMENTALNSERLRELARQAGDMAHQYAVFVVFASGTAEIIDLRD